MARHAESLAELQNKIRRDAETEIRGWAQALDEDPDAFVDEQIRVFAAHGAEISRILEDREAIERLWLLEVVLSPYFPSKPDVTIRIDPGLLKYVPATRPPAADSAVAELTQIAAELHARIFRAKARFERQVDQGDDQGTTFRRQIIAAFEGTPVLSRLRLAAGKSGSRVLAESLNGLLATLSLYLSPSHGCNEKRWENGARAWNAIHSAERRAINTLRTQ